MKTTPVAHNVQHCVQVSKKLQKTKQQQQHRDKEQMQRRLMEVDFFSLSIIKSLPEESVPPLILFQAAKTARTDIQRFRSMREVQLVGGKKQKKTSQQHLQLLGGSRK